MNAKQIIESKDFQRCVQFHGHICPGLSIGYRAVKAAMQALSETRAVDEELVTIVETDACSADAVQVLTGCTFGKGNFFYKDYGKMALTLLSRTSGRAIRICLKPEALPSHEEHQVLMKKITSGQATEEEQNRFKQFHQDRTNLVLETPLEALFTIESIDMEIPSRARVEPPVPCDDCKEPVMGSKLESYQGRRICRGCLDKINQGG